MTDIEKTAFENILKQSSKNEFQFLKENGCLLNPYEVYLYKSDNGNHRLILDMFLVSYKEWLIENKIVKEI